MEVVYKVDLSGRGKTFVSGSVLTAFLTLADLRRIQGLYRPGL